MTAADDVASDLEQLLTAPGQAQAAAGPAPSLSVVLATKLYLDRRILQENMTPRLLDTVTDDSGGILVRKYDMLTKQIWQKYRSKPLCRPLHFICETPLTVMNDMNVTFLIPEDFQFLGAMAASSGDDIAADQFFTESLKAASSDAYINAGVYRYRRGDRGVRDNFMLAKKHFAKALSVLHQMPLTIDEKTMRRKLATEAIDEIEYRFAPFIDKVVRFCIRMLTFRFEANVRYVGAAAPKGGVHVKMKELSDSILKREFDFKKEAFKKFITDTHEKLPVAQSHIEADLQEIESEYAAMATPEFLNDGFARLSEFYAEYEMLLERDSADDSTGPVAEQHMDPSVVAGRLATPEEIEIVASKYKLTSVGELVEMAGKPDARPAFIAWLVRDKLHEQSVMERLYSNASASADVKRVIKDRYMLTGQ